MKVKLLNYTPLEVADIAICKCYGNKPHSDSEKVKARINRVANVSKHASTIEHLYYNFDIDGISRASLQEVARHRIASYTVKSSRYTLQDLKKEKPFITYASIESMIPVVDYERAEQYVRLTLDENIDFSIVSSLDNLRKAIYNGIPNDIAKYCMPEAYKTSLVMSINARSLQNFLELRTSKHALKEIQDLAKALFEATPNEHKFLFKGFMND